MSGPTGLEVLVHADPYLYGEGYASGRSEAAGCETVWHQNLLRAVDCATAVH